MLIHRPSPMTPSRLAWLALAIALAVLTTGCPTPPEETSDVDDGAGNSTPDIVDDTDNGAATGGDNGPGSTGGTGDIDEPEPDLPEGACTTDEECIVAEGLPQCRVSACVSNECVLVDAEDGAECSDGDLCTLDDVCTGGECGGTTDDCNDDNECTNDACDPLGGCVNTNHQKPCDDGTACTVGDHCFQGTCSGDEITCDDANVCTTDSCDPVTGCVQENNDGPCTDGSACTDGDTCVDGSCVPGPELVCPTATECLDVVCDPLVGCVSTILDGECDDSNECTEGDLCMDGVCSGTVVPCDDDNACTSDTCQPATGCVFTNNLNACDDEDECTLGDQCNTGACVPGPVDPLCCDDDEGCDDGDPCTADTCVVGYCSFLALNCDDGHDCTADECVGGLCEHAPYGPLPGGTLLEEGFEYGGQLEGWAVTSTNADVTWQLDTSQAHGGLESLYCGNIPAYSYDFGQTLATATKQVPLPPGQAMLSFWIQQDIAEASCSFDVTTILVNGEPQEPVLCATILNWTEQTYDLTAYAGSTVSIVIQFDTADTFANAGGGVWIDDFVVSSDAPSSCCLVDDDCTGTGCEAATCGEESFQCEPEPASVTCDDEDPCTLDVCAPGGACDNQPIEGCCETADTCPADDLVPCGTPVCNEGQCGVDYSTCCETPDTCASDPELPCAVATCVDQTCGLDTSGCCEDALECPGDEGQPCAVATCEAGECGLDTSACCSEANECPGDEAQPCAVATCDDGTCGLDTSACCAEANECPGDEAQPCAVATCDEGTCGLDTSACCTDAEECPGDEGQPCAVPTCDNGECGLDTSGCQ